MKKLSSHEHLSSISSVDDHQDDKELKNNKLFD